MKRYLAMILSLALVFSAAGCGRAKGLFEGSTAVKEAESQEAVDESGLKVGFLFPSATDASDTASHLEGVRKMQQETGLLDSQVVIKSNVSKEDYESEIDSLVEKGCNIIFSKSADSEDAMVAAAERYPDVQFCQEDGKQAKKSGLSNMHNYYVKLYEAYYTAGVAAGMKLNHMLNDGKISSDSCVIGFAASRENAENISCINAFYLGVGEVCSQASMIVRYVGSKDVYDDDGECARQLVAAGAKLMCQRTFTTAVATVCAENDIPVIGNDINIIDIAPKEAITSATTDWSVYYTYAVNAVMEGTEMEADWCGSYQDGSVYLTQLNDSILVDGTVDKIKDVEKSLRSGKCKVFDTTKFTVEGESLESLVSGSDTYKSYKKYVSNGAYHESSKRSAPTMKFLVDGVSKITGNYLETEDTTDAESETDSSTDSSTEQ